MHEPAELPPQPERYCPEEQPEQELHAPFDVVVLYFLWDELKKQQATNESAMFHPDKQQQRAKAKAHGGKSVSGLSSYPEPQEEQVPALR